jgi:nucleotide-binding universal stress UspA family protein
LVMDPSYAEKEEERVTKEQRSRSCVRAGERINAMFQPIVVPLDGSPLAETALAPACALARRFDAKVVLVSACPGSTVAEMGVYLTRQVDRLIAEGISVRAVLPPLSPVEGICDELAFVSPAVIVMTTHGRAGLDALLHPRATWDLFTQITAPILVCPYDEHRQTPPERQLSRFLTDQAVPILIPLDGSLLAEQALPLAQELSQACGNPLVLVRAVEPALVGSAWEGAATQWALVEAESYLKRKQAELISTGLQVAITSGLGLASTCILDSVKQEQAGLIVMGSHGRNWWGRLVLGSVTRSVLHQAEVPILLVRSVSPQEESRPVQRAIETSSR